MWRNPLKLTINRFKSVYLLATMPRVLVSLSTNMNNRIPDVKKKVLVRLSTNKNPRFLLVDKQTRTFAMNMNFQVLVSLQTNKNFCDVLVSWQTSTKVRFSLV